MNQVLAKMKPLAINCLMLKFKIHLEVAGVVVGLIVNMFHYMFSYATEFISLSSTNYQSVWWKLFHSLSAGQMY